MNVFAISFRIGNEGQHKDRYDSLVERIKKIAVGYTSEETTSFYVIKSALSASEIRDDLYFQTSFNNYLDLLIVIDLSTNDYAYKGTFDHLPLLTGLLNDR